MNDCQYIKEHFYKRDKNIKLIEVNPKSFYGYNVLKVEKLDWFTEDKVLVRLIRLEDKEYKTLFLRRKKIRKILNESSSYRTFQDNTVETFKELEQIKQTKTIQGTYIEKVMLLLAKSDEREEKEYKEKEKQWENL